MNDELALIRKETMITQLSYYLGNSVESFEETTRLG
jgi:hypothetical protein